MGWIKRSLFLLFFFSFLTLAFSFLVRHQGLDSETSLQYKDVRIEFDSYGIPTLVGQDWKALIEAQGYVTAGHRLWQMDLIRRKVGGRLSEWFGEKALEHDISKQREDRLNIVQREADAMPVEERAYCDAFARGVNSFIESHPWQWGLEYLLLRTKPEAWTCSDSLLVLLEMNDSLTAIADEELEQFRWKRHLPKSWQTFLFGHVHPWNKAYFDPEKSESFQFPETRDSLPEAPIQEPKIVSRDILDPDPVGSNSWGWIGKSGFFLANDPHLTYSVPAIWYAIRLRKDAENWVVGASIPGIPGVTIGMTPFYAWTFTNSGEDVDDYLEETVSPDGTTYLSTLEGGKEIWAPIERKTFALRIKGQKEPQMLEAKFTHRGPLLEKPHLGPGAYSRQWLPLKPGMLRLPTFSLLLGQSIEDFHRAIDHMKVPAQNALVMDRGGNLTYRMTGTGVVRKGAVETPVAALEGEWQGFEPPSSRRRLSLTPDDGLPQFLATANERIWIDPHGGHWASEDRKYRITEMLRSKEEMTQDDMKSMQFDTSSRFRKLLLTWLDTHASKQLPLGESMRVRWRSWDGNSRSDSKIFAESTLAEKILSEVLLDRVKRHFLSEKDQSAPYTNYARRNWLTAFLERSDEKAAQAFGTTRTALADYVIAKVWNQNSTITPHERSNAIETQHPFATRIPIFGKIFATSKSLQWGAGDLVLAEKPQYGPSMRIVWNLSDPFVSTWNFPIGQSGHVGSPFYSNLQTGWPEKDGLEVFDKRFNWSLVKIAQPERKTPTKR